MATYVLYTLYKIHVILVFWTMGGDMKILETDVYNIKSDTTLLKGL